jgi:hypothetical protein
MGFIKRTVTPRPAKKVVRAVERPAKTARQIITPTPVQKPASRAWRATDPAGGIRQEVEGRAVDRTRRRLHGLGQPAASPDADTNEVSFDEAVAIMTRAGWTPQEIAAEVVPVLSEINRFSFLSPRGSMRFVNWSAPLEMRRTSRPWRSSTRSLWRR